MQTLVLIITQFSDQVKISLTSQLEAFQENLFRYFSGTIISTFSMSPSLVLPVIFALKLNESAALSPLKITISPPSTADISLQYYHKLPDVLK